MFGVWLFLSFIILVRTCWSINGHSLSKRLNQDSLGYDTPDHFAAHFNSVGDLDSRFVVVSEVEAGYDYTDEEKRTSLEDWGGMGSEGSSADVPLPTTNTQDSTVSVTTTDTFSASATQSTSLTTRSDGSTATSSISSSSIIISAKSTVADSRSPSTAMTNVMFPATSGSKSTLWRPPTSTISAYLSYTPYPTAVSSKSSAGSSSIKSTSATYPAKVTPTFKFGSSGWRCYPVSIHSISFAILISAIIIT